MSLADFIAELVITAGYEAARDVGFELRTLRFNTHPRDTGDTERMHELQRLHDELWQLLWAADDVPF